MICQYALTFVAFWVENVMSTAIPMPWVLHVIEAGLIAGNKEVYTLGPV